MSERTGIEWATSTGNPWIGCTMVSPGCKNCYAAELDAKRFSRTMGGGTKAKPISHWGKGAPRIRTKSFWRNAIVWNTEAGRYHYSPVRPTREFSAFGWRPHKPRIFPSLCDWLDDEVPIEWLADFLKLIHDTPNLDWLLLTKRPENFKERLHRVNLAHEEPCELTKRIVSPWIDGHAPQNVWIGVSVEDQKRVDERIPQLLQIPARLRFLSVEPLLESVDLHLGGMAKPGLFHSRENGGGLDWVIGGLESGKDRRDSKNGVADLIDVANQCIFAGIPFFCKQDCALKPGRQGRIPDDIWKLKQFPC